MDSFKKLLMEDDDFAIPEQKLRDIEKRVQNSTQSVRFVAKTADLFLPKAVDVMLSLFGAKSSKAAERKAMPPGHQSDPANGGV